MKLGGGRRKGARYHIQCKHGARVNVTAAYAQACRDSAAEPEPREPIVVSRVNGGPILVTLGFAAFVELARQAERVIRPGFQPRAAAQKPERVSRGVYRTTGPEGQ